MPRLPVHEACRRCGEDLTNFLRAIGVCGRCMQTPAVLTSVPRPTYSLFTPRAGKETTWRRP